MGWNQTPPHQHSHWNVCERVSLLHQCQSSCVGVSLEGKGLILTILKLIHRYSSSDNKKAQFSLPYPQRRTSHFPHAQGRKLLHACCQQGAPEQADGASFRSDGWKLSWVPEGCQVGKTNKEIRFMLTARKRQVSKKAMTFEPNFKHARLNRSQITTAEWEREHVLPRSLKHTQGRVSCLKVIMVTTGTE